MIEAPGMPGGSGMSSAMRAASQLPGRGPLVWILSLYMHVNEKSCGDDDDNDFILLLNLNTVDSRYLEIEGTLKNTSRYPYFDISD